MRIEAELFKNCGMNISDVVSVFYGMEAKFVSCTVHKSAFDTTASHPDREGKDVVVSSIGALRAGSTAKLGRKKHECLVEETASVEIHQQGTDRLVDSECKLLMVGLQATVGVPCPSTAATVLDLDKTHATFNKSPCRE